MSTKKKQAVVWFRFKFRDTPAARMQVQRAADKLFRLACVTERGQYTEEEVVRMVKAAIEKAKAERHICRNCKNGINHGDDGVYCRIDGEWRDDFGNGTRKGFGEDCESFERWPEDDGEEFEEP